MLIVTAPTVLCGFVLDGLADLLGHDPRSLEVGVGEEGHELLTTEPGHEITRAQRGLDERGDVPEHVVSDPVAVGVVDRLEQVDIEHQDGGRRIASAQARELRLEAVHAGEAVGQPP